MWFIQYKSSGGGGWLAGSVSKTTKDADLKVWQINLLIDWFIDWLIDWILIYVVSAIFQPYNSVVWQKTSSWDGHYTWYLHKRTQQKRQKIHVLWLNVVPPNRKFEASLSASEGCLENDLWLCNPRKFLINFLFLIFFFYIELHFIKECVLNRH